MDDQKRDGRLSAADERFDFRDKAADDELSDDELSDVGGGRLVRARSTSSDDEDTAADGRFLV